MLTIAMPYYDNPGMLALQHKGWAAWPDDLRAKLKIILVDDGSPTYPAQFVPRPEGLSIEIYRVLQDKPWHQHGARNLAAHVAGPGWMLITDMDHVLEPDQAARLIGWIERDELEPRGCFMLERIEADTRKPTLGKFGQPKPHPNSFVLTRETYWRIGGYDEWYCGVYGTDKLFRDRAFTRAIRGELPIHIVRYWRDLVPDASTTSLPRKEGRRPGEKADIARQKAHAGKADEILTLAFEWKRVV